MCISLIGSWMQSTAQPWLAYTLTKSAFLLSLIGVAQFTPILLFSLYAGVIVDRFPKKRIIVFTQSMSLIITLILAILTLTGVVRYWHILILAFSLGLVNTLDMPTRQSFVIELVGKEDLMNAIALNSTVFNLARIIGPTIAGIVMGTLGVAFCFFINSISFAAVVISLIFVKPIFVSNLVKKSGKVFEDIKDGLKYVYKNPLLFNTILVMTFVGTFAMNFSVLLPVFVKDVLHQKEAGFGLLMSFMGFGSFSGAMLIATMSKSGPKKFILNVFPVFIGMFLILTGFTHIFFLTAICLAATGFCFVSLGSNANTVMQINSDNTYRGRVMSVNALVTGGMLPVGNLFTGIVTQRFGPQVGFIICGSSIILLMIILNIYKHWRDNHLKK